MILTALLSVVLNVVLIIILVWLIVLIIALVTLSRRKDITLPVKIFWAAVIFFAPVVGLILYFVFSFRKKDRNIERYKNEL